MVILPCSKPVGLCKLEDTGLVQSQQFWIMQIRRVAPSEFESLGGRAAAKKWKSSIKVRGVAGFDNREIGQYLRDELGV